MCCDYPIKRQASAHGYSPKEHFGWISKYGSDILKLILMKDFEKGM
jgi:hypothetical protein